MASIFGEAYRSFHEPHVDQTRELVHAKLEGALSADEIRTRLHDRDRKWRLECESNNLLTYLVDDLAVMFPEARFICTVRHPRPWMKSMMNTRINTHTSKLPDYHQKSRSWRRALYEGLPPSEFPDEEHALISYAETYGIRNIDSYLRGWVHQYQHLLMALPNDRALWVRTEDISNSIDQVARFVGVSASTLSRKKSHVNSSSADHALLAQIDKTYLRRKIESHCEALLSKMEERIGKQLKPTDS